MPANENEEEPNPNFEDLEDVAITTGPETVAEIAATMPPPDTLGHWYEYVPITSDQAEQPKLGYPADIHGLIPETLIHLALQTPTNKTVRALLQKYTLKPIPDELVTVEGLFKFVIENKVPQAQLGTPGTTLGTFVVEAVHRRDVAGSCRFYNSESGFEHFNYTPQEIDRICVEADCETFDDLLEAIETDARDSSDDGDIDYELDGEEETTDHEFDSWDNHRMEFVLNKSRREQALLTWMQRAMPELLNQLQGD